MIIDAKTITLTLVIVVVAGYFGLQFIRQLTLSIAQENHDANLAMDMTEEAKRARRQRDADAAASAAFEKVENLLPASVIKAKANPTNTNNDAATESEPLSEKSQSNSDLAASVV
mmetsp:Transcript_19771/g.30850  ORF Transcript_19771/g.30850 Transcript_19771/m.30850 type:complete len:115 (+) Transcript_19771:167-511(+)